MSIFRDYEFINFYVSMEWAFTSLPICCADITKLVFAEAGHMVAPLVFLNVCFTVLTLLIVLQFYVLIEFF